jgi:dihydrofolate synthase/folylpolyglutamate synthase
VILEVGLGGRLDAVNAFDADCSVITSVDIDHVEYLGPDRESIGREKAGILRAGRPAIIADPVPPASVIAAGEALGADLWLVGRDFNQQGDRQQWSWSGRGRRYHALSYPALRGANQLLNASGPSLPWRACATACR